MAALFLRLSLPLLFLAETLFLPLAQLLEVGLDYHYSSALGLARTDITTYLERE